MASRDINKIIVHCSASAWGDAKTIRRWHAERGFSDIGYHAVILNGHRTASGAYKKTEDGLVEYGRSLNVVGAHTRGHNDDSLGLCLIGSEGLYTLAQIRSTIELLKTWMEQFNLHEGSVFGHRDFNAMKTCPDFETDELRKLLAIGGLYARH